MSHLTFIFEWMVCYLLYKWTVCATNDKTDFTYLYQNEENSNLTMWTYLKMTKSLCMVQK